MKEFVLLFFGGEPESTGDLPKHYAEYGEFMNFLNKGNHFKSGIPVDPSGGRMVYKDKVETSGDFMSPSERLGGVMVIEAANFDQAVSIAAQNPIIKNGGRVMIRPTKQM